MTGAGLRQNAAVYSAAAAATFAACFLWPKKPRTVVISQYGALTVCLLEAVS